MFSKLRGKIVEVCDTQSKFADKLGISEQTVTAKLNGRSEFSRPDMLEWAKALNLSEGEIGTIFFADDFQNGKVNGEE